MRRWEGLGEIEDCFFLISEEVRSVPDKLVKFKANKHYLQATELLKNSGE